MRIRPESSEDFDSIHGVVQAAFGRTAEAELVRAIRGSDGYVPNLTLVAEDGGEIVGHIMLSYVLADDRRVLCLAPVAVRPDRQRDGIGSALVRASLQAADALDEPLVVLTGHAEYYPRFGFTPARASGIEPPDPNLPDAVFMVRRLGAYDSSIRGRIVYPPAFDRAAD